MKFPTSLKLVFRQLKHNLVLDSKLVFQEACTHSHYAISLLSNCNREYSWAREVLEAFADYMQKIHVGFTEEEIFSWSEEERVQQTSCSTLQRCLIQQYGAMGQIK